MASQMDDPEPAIDEQSNSDALMQASNTCQTTGKIETVQLDISLVRRDTDCFCTRLAEAEHRVGDSEDTLQEHTALETRVEDGENRNRGAV